MRVGAWSDGRAIAAGGDNTCGIRRDGSLGCARPVAWDVHVPRLSLTRIGSDSDWVRVSSRDRNMACALRRDGTLWCQRDLRSGQFPTMLEQLWPETRWSDILGGQYPTFGVQPDGSLWSLNPIRRTGESPILTPQRIDLPRACAAATGGGTFWCALDEDSVVWCFGHNDYGLGTGATTAEAITRVTGPLGQPLPD